MALETPKARVDCIRAADILKPLAPAALEALQSRLETVVLEPGESLFRQGDAADALFVVHDGVLRVELKPDSGEPLLAQITAGQPVGEIQVLTGGPRTASATAATRCELVRVPAAALREVLDRAPDALARVASIARRRLLYTHQRSVLGDYFGPLDEILLAGVEAEGEWLRVRRGETLFRAGDAPGGFYLVISGRLRALTEEASGEERTRGEIRRGDSIGEMALFTGEPRAATVRAVRDSVLLRFGREAFDRLLADHPQLLHQIVRVLATRLAGTTAGAPARAAIALVPAGPGVPIEAFAQRLAAALAQWGSVRRISSERVEKALETSGVASAAQTDPQALRVDLYLDECEARHRFVLYACDPSPGRWSRRCLERADLQILVGRVADAPMPQELELVLKKAPDAAPLDLVLTHAANVERPPGSHGWLSHRRVRRFHHVRPELPEDMARLARFTGGRPLGVALGGGGAPGVVQLGAIAALREAGVEPDMIAGAGIGAHLAVGMALGWDVETARERALEAARAALPQRRGSPRQRLEACLAEQFGDAQLEDSWLPVLGIAGDLLRGEPRILSYGHVREVLLACLLPPGAAEPVDRGPSLLADGGYGSEEATRALREAGIGTIVSVDAAPRFTREDLAPLSGGPVPSSILSLLRRPGAATRGGDLRLKVAVSGDPLAGPEDLAAQVEAGRERTRPLLDSWVRSRDRRAGE